MNSLAQRLIQHGLLDETTAQQAHSQSMANSLSFIGYLLESKLIPPAPLAMVIAQTFGLPLLDINAVDPTFFPIKLVNHKLIHQHHILPLLLRGKQLFLAVCDPTQQAALDEIKFHTGANTIHCIVVEADKLARIIEQQASTHAITVLDDLNNTALNELAAITEEKNITLNTTETEDAPIVRYVHKILLDAIHKGASDVHFEPYEKHYRIRYRLDGILYEIASPSTDLANRITTRIKIMAQLDISERRIPQDGRCKISLTLTRAIDFRVSVLPTVHGEKIVVRILDPNNTALTIDALGLELSQEKLFAQALSKPHGMILVTGPTGSGKTITLYTALNKLNTSAVNISTVEDPVEIHLAGINQVNVNPKTGLTFATVLRALLRQDPDIIMVGEMRDLETAEIGIKAAQTGHLVLSTLHTNNAPETLTRLINMGVPAYNIATSISLIVAQRLARRLCDHCKKITTISHEPHGCEHCINGYKGRIGIFEILPVTEAISELIMRGSNVLEIAAQARAQGMQTLRDSGLHKVKQGVTSLAEINRVTKD